MFLCTKKIDDLTPVILDIALRSLFRYCQCQVFICPMTILIDQFVILSYFPKLICKIFAILRSGISRIKLASISHCLDLNLNGKRPSIPSDDWQKLKWRAALRGHGQSFGILAMSCIPYRYTRVLCRQPVQASIINGQNTGSQYRLA